jgi:hypothetical protein
MDEHGALGLGQGPHDPPDAVRGEPGVVDPAAGVVQPRAADPQELGVVGVFGRRRNEDQPVQRLGPNDRMVRDAPGLRRGVPQVHHGAQPCRLRRDPAFVGEVLARGGAEHPSARRDPPVAQRPATEITQVPRPCPCQPVDHRHLH